MGATELVAYVLMLLTSLGAKPNPNAPSGQEAMRYAPARADVVLHLDFEAFVPGTLAAMQQIQSHPIIKAEPALRRAATQALDTIAAGRATARAAAGLDPFETLRSATVFVTITAGKPEVIGVARGAWPPDVLERMGAMSGEKTVLIDGKPVMKLPDGQFAVGLDGANLIAGNTNAVEARLKKSWRPLGSKAGSPFARVTALLDTRPLSLVAWAPSAFVLAQAEKELRGDDLMLGRELASLPFAATWLAADGLGWVVQTRDASGVERARMASDGVVALLRAGHHATRGMSRIALATLPSFVKSTPELALAVKHTPAILAILDGLGGDGNFKADVTVNAKDRTVQVVAKGSRLSEVLPAAGLLPVMGAGAAFFMLGRSVTSSPVMIQSAPMPAPAPKPIAKPKKK